MTTKEIATPREAEIAQAYRAIIDGEHLPASVDPEVISRAIMERIMAAETFEEAFKPQDLEGWQTYLDQRCIVRGFHLNPSGFEGEGGASVYAVVDIELLDSADPEGELTVTTVTCGGRNVLVQLVKMLEKGWLDRPVRLTAKETSQPGQKALWLVAA